MKTLSEIFKIWDKGGIVYPDIGDTILNTREGNTIPELGNLTKCPVGNGTCVECIILQIPGQDKTGCVNFEKVMMCCAKVVDAEDCPLNK